MQMMMLEPEKRIDVDAALRHPFVKDFLPKKDKEHGSGPAATATTKTSRK